MAGPLGRDGIRVVESHGCVHDFWSEEDRRDMTFQGGRLTLRDGLVVAGVGLLGVIITGALSGVLWNEEGPAFWTMPVCGSITTVLLMGLVGWRRRDRRRAEAASMAALATERRFRAVVEEMPAGVIVLGRRGEDGVGLAALKCEVANAAAAALAGIPVADMVGRALAEVFRGDGAKALLEVADRCVRTGEPGHVPATRKLAVQSDAWVESSVFLLDSGDAVVLLRDLSAQKETESGLRRARHELELALDALQVGLWIRRPGQSWVNVDVRCSHLVGMDREGTAEISDFLHRVHPDDRARAQELFEEAQEHGPEREAEYRVATRIGGWRRLCSRARTLKDEFGAVIQVAGFTWDVTERREMEARVDRMRRMESLGTLANGVAHNLNNALAPVAMGMDLLLRRHGDDIIARDTLETMKASVSRAATVVRQLADSTHGAVGRLGHVSPTDILREMGEHVNRIAGPQIECAVDYPLEDLPAVLADAAKVKEAVLEVCRNACDAMRGGGRLRLGCSVVQVPEHDARHFPGVRPGEYVAFEVDDTGPGIPEAIHDRIFDPFFSTGEIGRGTGLGLSSALGIARGHGGGITFTTAEGKGTQFRILFPVARSGVLAAGVPADRHAASSVATMTNEEQATEPARSRGGYRVLVADDEAPVRNLIRRVLEMEGFQVVTVADGKEAVAQFARDPEAIDLAILDLAMPVMDGATAAAAIMNVRPTARVIAATGFVAVEVIEDVRRTGVCGFLQKPFSVDNLLRAVDEALGRPPD